MTTYHPAHGPVSLDRLQQISEILSKAAAQSDGGNLGYAMADAVKVIDGAIAAFGAEPVLYAMQGVNLDTDAISTSKSVVDSWVDEWNQERKLGVPEYKTVPLYTAPPAPVVPDELLSVMEEVLRISDRDHEAWHKARNGIASCRDAMLQGIQPVSNRDALPLDYLQGHKDGLEWAAQLAEANHPQTGDWLYDDPIELAKAIRKGPDMPDGDGNSLSKCSLREGVEAIRKSCIPVDVDKIQSECDAGNSPVTPDGWALVPVEPTEDMIVNGFESEPDESFSDEKEWEAYDAMSGCQQAAHRAKLCWSAMIAASPAYKKVNRQG